MKKQVLVAGLLAATLCMPLAACGGSSTSSTGSSSSSTTSSTSTTSSGSSSSSSSSKDFDANSFYVGQWRGSVEITGQTVYGTAGGTEQMLDVNIKDDGTCEVKPLEAHVDLLTDTGTWEGTETELTLNLSSGKTITLEVADKSSLKGNAADFGIADFDTINFDFYG
ncbi:hypothetical protein [Olsenella sp. Marseille-P4559]|uniref:hypothetical protein n=1 Tax=Olsenella sp. Marseille-P4559 TaxID=2364795 RepID=UPI0010300946|nr:hypothetical protein [Olsenella sp. Marseille-P4559]